MFYSCTEASQMPRMPLDGKSTFEKHIKYILSLLCIQKVKVRKLNIVRFHYNLFQFSVDFYFYVHRYTKTGQLAIAGFSDPIKDASEDDLKLWMPDPDNPPTDLDLAQARFLLAKVADQFCDLFVQEKMAMPENMATDSKCIRRFIKIMGIALIFHFLLQIK